MAEGKTVKLAVIPIDTPDRNKCIICQKSSSELTSGTENGRKRIREAASIRNDVVSKRLKLIGDTGFVYHMSNQCYKTYTLKKSLEKVTSTSCPSDLCQESCSTPRGVRSQSTSRPKPTPQCEIYKQRCVVCGCVKHQGIYKKHRISESDRANKFLEATVFLKDDVYTRTCDLQDINSVFGADLFCHKACINRYLLQFERASVNWTTSGDQTVSSKETAWSSIIKDIEIGISTGEGYELSFVRDSMNRYLESEHSVTNREVKVLIANHFGDRISFSQPKQANKSHMFFSKNVTADDMAETIRCTDPIKQCAQLIRQSLLDTDFGLQDRFCDANDLKQSWDSVPIPGPLLIFFATLYNFNADELESCRHGETPEDELDGSGPGVSESRCRQMQSLFQIMFHNIHRGKKRTPLHIMNSQAIYDACKSATLITSFNRFGLCTSYDELMRHHTNMASFTVENSTDTVPFPSHFDKGMFTIAAFDNFDHDEATLSGMDGSHDTVTVLFQDDDASKISKPKISETNVQHGAKAFSVELGCQQLRQFYKPVKRATLPEDFTVADSHPVKRDLLSDVRATDVAWVLGRLDLPMEEDMALGTRPMNQTMPIWSAANSVLTAEHVPLKRVAFLPVLPYPVTQYDAVYTAMKNLQGILEYLHQPKLAVTCDEGVYRIAREIQLIRPAEFDNIVLCLGSFHMAKVALGCLGKYLKGSGTESILVESSVFGMNTVDSVLNGKNYVRSLKGQQVLKETLARLQWAAFFEEEDRITKYRGELNTIMEMRTMIAKKSRVESAQLLQQFKRSSAELLGEFDHFVRTGTEESETFKYWDTFIRLMTYIENLIRSDREGNWILHLQSVQDLLPIFAAFDSINYLRWCSLYLEDMFRLPETAPEVYDAFMEGKFVVKRTPGFFKAVGADMALEQTINRSQKSSGGIIGSSRRKQYVARWEIVYHEMLAITNLHREMAGLSSASYELEVNRAFKTATTKQEEENIRSILDVITRNENPFTVPSAETKLHNILTREVMTEDIRNQLLSAETIGKAAYDKLRKERFCEKSVRLSETIHRTNLKTFSSIHKAPASKTKGSVKSSKKEDAEIQRMLDIAKERGKSMDEMLKYDVCSKSQLFDEEGLMTKATKSQLVQELEKRLLEEDPKAPNISDTVETGYIVDVMANVRKIRTKGNRNFGEFCDAFLSFVDSSTKGKSRIDLVFDSYIDQSVKDSERRRREKRSPILLHQINRETPMPVEMETFWPSSGNKTKLESHLHQTALDYPWTLSTPVIVVSNFRGPGDVVLPCYASSKGSLSEVEELNIDIEEADARTIPHAMHAVTQGVKRIVVLSSDTDVFIHMMYYWDNLHAHGLDELWVKAGVGESTRFLPIHILVERIGQDLCRVLPAIHTLTGCDFTSKIGTKHAALLANPLLYLKDFGTNTVDQDSIIARAEEYLTRVLKKGSSFKTFDQLRSHIYHHSKCVSFEQLPPTSYAIRSHILRALYGTIQITSLLTTNHESLDPTLYGFVKEDELLMTDMSRRPIPEELAVRCNCIKCATGKCSCFRNGVPCCTFCKCHSVTELDSSSCKNVFG